MQTQQKTGNIIRLQLPRNHYRLNVDITVPARGITVLFGESGSGKTSLLRCIAGLERAENAYIQWADQCWQDDANHIFKPTWQRSLGYVFQEPSLFMHMNVQENLLYGLQRQPRSNKNWFARLSRHLPNRQPQLPDSLRAILQLLGIEHLLQQHPGKLSGGEQQRVAIARALAIQPQVLLLDEPLASLDASRRHEVLPWLEHLRDELAVPLLYITHSLSELERLADQVIILQNGQVVASDSFEALCNSGKLSELTELEHGTRLNGHIVAKDTEWHQMAVKTPAALFWITAHPTSPLRSATIGQNIRLQIPAHGVIISLHAFDSGLENTFKGVIRAMRAAEKYPEHVLLQIEVAGQLLGALITRKKAHTLQLCSGTDVFIHITQVNAY